MSIFRRNIIKEIKDKVCTHMEVHYSYLMRNLCGLNFTTNTDDEIDPDCIYLKYFYDNFIKEISKFYDEDFKDKEKKNEEIYVYIVLWHNMEEKKIDSYYSERIYNHNETDTPPNIDIESFTFEEFKDKVCNIVKSVDTVNKKTILPIEFIIEYKYYDY